ncbi:TetR/AcrR family transcriptional regulator [Vibrio gallaecicus]|uniref:TetR/AcrR family transcriptional regulator n=1 Tax=Vibrio gallaecicus TaxID=552386 RepID=UPI0010C9E566|nr:TetR/AcrR family transcriptional regulator [Vibrio gallaecicus]MDN3616835.1 TetR/AcrR family transcriptional regulator [Vibrio gallaecicus]
MNEKTNDTRQHILDVGYQLIVSKGFTSVGLSELLKVAGVPKGSFYHYFKSKEQFGEALILDYFEQYMTRIESILIHGDGSDYQRLNHYFTQWLTVNSGTCNAHKCLVVKLSAEVSDLSDSMRKALLQGADQITFALQECIESGVQDGSIRVKDSQETAQTLYALWLGSSLLSKLNQNTQSLELALRTTEKLLHESI